MSSKSLDTRRDGIKYKLHSDFVNNAIEHIMDDFGHSCRMLGLNKFVYNQMTKDFVLTHAEFFKTILKSLESKYNDNIIVEIKRLPVGNETIYRKAWDGYIHILKPKFESSGFFSWFRPSSANYHRTPHHYSSIIIKYRAEKKLVRAFKTIINESKGKPPLMCYLQISQLPSVPIITAPVNHSHNQYSYQRIGSSSKSNNKRPHVSFEPNFTKLE